MRSRTLFAIRDGRLDPNTMPRKTARSRWPSAIATMIKNQGRADIAALEREAGENRAAMHHAAISEAFRGSPEGDFDPASMKRLYAFGRDVGERGVRMGDGGRPAASPETRR